MKQIILILVGVAVLFFIGVSVFGTKASVETPEIKKTGTYERPVREGNCYRQRDTAGNNLLVCG